MNFIKLKGQSAVNLDNVTTISKYSLGKQNCIEFKFSHDHDVSWIFKSQTEEQRKEFDLVYENLLNRIAINFTSDLIEE